MSENFKTMQAENYQLRDYIINLQSRLIESQGDFPQPPPNVDLPHPSHRPPSDRLDGTQASRPSAMDVSALNQLRVSAAQANSDTGPPPGKHYPDEGYEHDTQMAKRRKSDESSSAPATSAQEALQGGTMAVESRTTTSPQSHNLTIGSVLNGSNREGNGSRQMLPT